MRVAGSQIPSILAVGAPEAYLQRLAARGYAVCSADDKCSPTTCREDVLLYWQSDREAARPLVEGMPSLKWVHVPWVGVESLLFPRICSGEVMLTNSPGVAAIPVAEYVMGALLVIAKSFRQHFDDQRARHWPSATAFSRELADRRLLVVGYGDIGSRVGRYAQALGMQVDGVARAPRHAGDVAVHGMEQLDALLAQADFVVLAVPSTLHTRPLMTSARLARLRRDAWLINIGRGDCIDEAALLKAVRLGAIGGAWLDVVGEEPLRTDSPLWKERSIVITPHASSWTQERFDRSFELFEQNLEQMAAGRPLSHLVVPSLPTP